MAEQVTEQQSKAPDAAPTSNETDRTQVMPSARSVGREEATDDPTIVRENRPVVEEREAETPAPTRNRSLTPADYVADLQDRRSGFYWGADFIGFAVALFFTILFLGIVGAVAGIIGYVNGAPLPKAGHTISSTAQNIGIGVAAASVVGLFLAYLIGGYTAARMARFSGAKNGLGVVLWTVIVATILGAAGAMLHTRLHVASQLHLSSGHSTLTVAGIAALVVALAIMLLGAVLGGKVGEQYHRRIDRDAAEMT
ncbi:MAG TPA: Yip1 family protein [Chloroflexota bacterium]